MKLVIAEKPSVAMALASVLGARTRKDGYVEGNGYIVSWCVGHLVGLCDASEYDEKYKKWRYEDLPIVPECWRHKVLDGTKKQYGILKKLMRDSNVDEVICATDAGREGELIFRLVYEQAGCKKPMKRLWISSMEEQAIKDGFASLKDGSCYDSLYQSALCRAKADWLVGINASRLFSVLYNQNLKVGRVQTPTLAMLTERQDRIEHFQKETFYRVELTDGKLVAVSENITNKADAELLAALCDGSEAIITELKREQKKVSPPKLYDLTSLQREANRYFGFTAKKTLDLLQELYEEKLVTYPRTDSRFVTEGMIGTVEELAGKMPLMLPFVEYGQLGHNIKRVVNNAKVSDHHAILPTKEAVEKGIVDLPVDKKNLMILIGQQVIQAVGEDYLYEQTDVTVNCQKNEFTARGKTAVQMGFKDVEKAFRSHCVKTEKEDSDRQLEIPYGYQKGMQIFNVKAETSIHYTSPPKSFNEDTLLAAMETAGNKEFDEKTEKKGLGTPATRASTIEKLVASGYAQRKGKQIIPTAEGRELIRVMPENLKSAGLTAEWENRLLLMERGELNGEQFMDDIVAMLKEILNGCRKIPEEERNRFQTAKELIGKCPVCGSDIFEGKRNFYCSNRQCDFALWKDNRFLEGMEKKLDKKMAKELLDKACTHVKGLYSKKKDARFDADLLMTLENGKPKFHLEFPKRKHKG